MASLNLILPVLVTIIACLFCGVKQNDASATCNVSVPCDCCLNEQCKPNLWCINGKCKNGYWGAKCIKKCPELCISCHRNFINEKTCYECKPGYHNLNNNCSNICPKDCKDRICDKDGFCKECEQGYFGIKTCNMTCPENCSNNDCEMESGSCSACVDGTYGEHCKMTCPNKCSNRICDKHSGQCISCISGHFGKYCDETCPSNCKNSVCDKDLGICIACITGYYGKNCSNSCSINCKDGTCNSDSGECTEGCKENYIGEKCDECKIEYHGELCDKKCSSNCLNNTCSRYNGSCISGCETGYSSEDYCCVNNTNCVSCSSYTDCTMCTNGIYGQSCNLNCPEQCVGPCRKTDGSCSKCKMNYYGSHCNRSCSENCKIQYSNELFQRCNQSSGICFLGCNEGYHGDRCSKNCSMHCTKACDERSGECVGCIENRFGPFCQYNCSEGCIPEENISLCHEKNGHCLTGCKNGFYGDTCATKESFTDEDQEESTGTGFPTTAVAGATGGAAVIIIISVVIIVVIRKRNQGQKDVKQSSLRDKSSKAATKSSGPIYQNTDFDGENCIFEEEDIETEVDQHTVPIQHEEENPYYSNTSRPVTRQRKEDLRQFLYKSDETYAEEFEFLPKGLVKPFTDARNSSNKSKNRYNMIYPYDDSRVKVRDTDSDYINASYIDGYQKKNEYIAAQGPTTKQIGEDFKVFWKMVWQEKIETIVMVTKLYEVTGMKCDQYWPKAGSSSNSAGISIECVKEERFAEFTVRSLNIAKGNEKRHINHVNFTAWPDKGVPNDVISLINLRHKVVKMRKMFDGPLLVHCSAGIGRTGTYIALDILTRQGSVEDHVDVLACVLNMRQQRVNMVQTLEQYKFLHHAVLWTLTSNIQPLHAERFVDLSWLDDRKLNEMFEQLLLDNFNDTEEEKQAVSDNKSVPQSNRQGADIPGNRHIVPLDVNHLSQTPSYINAVYVDSYKKQNRFITAMAPLPDTVTQFLSMIIQEDVACIVDLTPHDYNQDDVGEYLPPDNHDLDFREHLLRVSNREASHCFVKREIEIFDRNKGEENLFRTIHHYSFTSWNTSSALPWSAEDFVTLVNEVDATATKMEANGPIVVHCLSGAERSGLFCAAWLLIEHMTIEQEVSVLNTLRQVKTRRKTAFPSSEQIAFCFECVSSHLKYLDERVYSNT